MSAETMTAARPTLEQSEEHVPQRPTWRCRKCGHQWPCADARADLMTEAITYPTPVLVYLSLCHAAATADLLPGGLPPDLHDRFIGWARRQP
jgi:hypothetical protein